MSELCKRFKYGAGMEKDLSPGLTCYHVGGLLLRAQYHRRHRSSARGWGNMLAMHSSQVGQRHVRLRRHASRSVRYPNSPTYVRGCMYWGNLPQVGSQYAQAKDLISRFASRLPIAASIERWFGLVHKTYRKSRTRTLGEVVFESCA